MHLLPPIITIDVLETHISVPAAIMMVDHESIKDSLGVCGSEQEDRTLQYSVDYQEIGRFPELYVTPFRAASSKELLRLFVFPWNVN